MLYVSLTRSSREFERYNINTVHVHVAGFANVIGSNVILANSRTFLVVVVHFDVARFRVFDDDILLNFKRNADPLGRDLENTKVEYIVVCKKFLYET